MYAHSGEGARKNEKIIKKRKQKKKCRGYSYSTLSTAIAMGSQILVALKKKKKLQEKKSDVVATLPLYFLSQVVVAGGLPWG